MLDRIKSFFTLADPSMETNFELVEKLQDAESVSAARLREMNRLLTENNKLTQLADQLETELKMSEKRRQCQGENIAYYQQELGAYQIKLASSEANVEILKKNVAGFSELRSYWQKQYETVTSRIDNEDVHYWKVCHQEVLDSNVRLVKELNKTKEECDHWRREVDLRK